MYFLRTWSDIYFKLIKVRNLMVHNENISLIFQPAGPNMMNRRPRWLIPPEEVCVFRYLHACLLYKW